METPENPSRIENVSRRGFLKGIATAGALVLGVAEALVAGYSEASLQSGVALVLMLAIMIWQASRRPVVAETEAA